MAAEDFYLFFSGTQGHFYDPEADRAAAGTERGYAGLGEFEGISDRPGVKLNRWVWNGSVTSDASVMAAHKKLSSDPGYVAGQSLLIIYGYSAGGKNALKLCEMFDKSNGAASSAQKIVAVDLLVTVDPAAWHDSDKISRTLAKCVKRNLNYWQPKGGVSGSHFGDTTGNPATQKIDTFKRDEEHGKLNDAVIPEAKKAIRETLTEVPLAGVWDAVIGSWRGVFEFVGTGEVTWQETDPQRLKADPKLHAGTWQEVSVEAGKGVLNWQFTDDPKLLGSQRTFVARRPLGKTVKGDVLPAGRGFYEMTKRG